MSQCQTRGCQLARYHRGICAVPIEGGVRFSLPADRPLTPGERRQMSAALRDAKQGHKQLPYGPGDFTPWAGRNGQLTLGGIARGVCTSPLGALFGLALLVLLWLSGCA